MNKLPLARRAEIIGALVEGNSLRSTSRMTGAALNTCTRLLVEVGTACRMYQHETLRGLKCKRLQCDEIWAFCHAKERNVPEAKKGTFGYGDVWTWVAIDADTKLVPSWVIGRRDAATAFYFLQDLSERVVGRVQITTDGHNAYREAVAVGFGKDADYAQLIKLYGAPVDHEYRYSPPHCIGIRTIEIAGDPDPRHVSTSYVERQNLTMRMSMRRFTRLTNGFSKKVENLDAAVSLHFMAYNFAKIHRTLRVTPAMAAGVTDHLWDVEEIAGLVELP